MQLDIKPKASSDLAALDETANGYIDAPDLRLFVFALFFIFGGITSLNDVVIPKLKALFTLSYAEAMLVQSAFFAAYLLPSIVQPDVEKVKLKLMAPGADERLNRSLCSFWRTQGQERQVVRKMPSSPMGKK